MTFAPGDGPQGEIPPLDFSVNTANPLDDYFIFNLFNPASSREEKITYWQAKQLGWMPEGVSAVSVGYWANKLQARLEQEIIGSASGGGGGGGRGSIGPTYVEPDRDSVREQVRAYVGATPGRANKDRVESATDAYMQGSRSAFDQRETKQVDPWNAVQKLVRSSTEYQDIHQQRPESVDELDWVVDRQEKLRQIGLSAMSAENLGVEQARMGANDQALIQAAEMQFSTDTGRLLDTQKQKIKQSARAVMGLV